MKRLYYIATLAIALFASLPYRHRKRPAIHSNSSRDVAVRSKPCAREEEKKENGMPN